MLSNEDLNEISKNTKHSFKYLKNITIVNKDSRYAVGEDTCHYRVCF
jgi:hypothetical protein